MSQKLPVKNVKWVKDIFNFNESFIKRFDKESDEGYFLEVDVRYPKNLHNLHNDLPFFPKRMKIEKFEKLIANLQDKTEYVITHKEIKPSIKSWISFKESFF